MQRLKCFSQFLECQSFVPKTEVQSLAEERSSYNCVGSDNSKPHSVIYFESAVNESKHKISGSSIYYFNLLAATLGCTWYLSFMGPQPKLRTHPKLNHWPRLFVRSKAGIAASCGANDLALGSVAHRLVMSQPAGTWLGRRSVMNIARQLAPHSL